MSLKGLSITEHDCTNPLNKFPRSELGYPHLKCHSNLHALHRVPGRSRVIPNMLSLVLINLAGTAETQQELYVAHGDWNSDNLSFTQYYNCISNVGTHVGRILKNKKTFLNRKGWSAQLSGIFFLQLWTVLLRTNGHYC